MLAGIIVDWAGLRYLMRGDCLNLCQKCTLDWLEVLRYLHCSEALQNYSKAGYYFGLRASYTQFDCSQ
jgi:hypothetical protein